MYACAQKKKKNERTDGHTYTNMHAHRNKDINVYIRLSEDESYTGSFVLRICMLHVLYMHCIRRNIKLGGYLDTRRNI